MDHKHLLALVDRPSDHRTSVPIHRRNSRLARVQRGLLVYTGRCPHEWESSSRFYFLVLSRPRHGNASFSPGLQQTSIFSVTFGGGGPSHRLRTDLSFILCYIFRTALLLLLFLRVVGERGGGGSSPPWPDTSIAASAISRVIR